MGMNTALTSFALGFLSTASPCILPLYPSFLAYLSGQTQSGMGAQRYWLGVFVLAGVLTMMLALGGLIALLAVPIGRTLAILIPLSDGLILMLGGLLLLDRNPFSALPHIQIPTLRSPLLNAFLYGVLYGPITLPCSGPLVVSIFAISFTLAEALDKVWVFMWFGFGFGAPLLILALLSGTLQRQITALFAKHSRILNLVGGLLLISVAVYDLAVNWEMLKFYYS